jgi:LuxR family maltose regulon positive regulatory protein
MMVIADKAQYRKLPATIAAARAYLAGALGDMPGSIRYTRQNIDLLPKDDHYGREGAKSLLGIAHYANGDLEKAYRPLNPVLKL